jgi:predicted N-acetyltransferase YhbS
MKFELQTDDDQPEIDTMLDRGFGLARRTKTSYRLREGNTRVAELSLVQREPELGIIGAISYWPISIGAKKTPALLLGPLIIHHERQGQGIGLALMTETLARAKAAGHGLVLLVGDEPYYARVGFKRLPENKLSLPGPFEPKRFLYTELREGVLADAQGLVVSANR